MGPAATATYAAIERAKTRMNIVYQEALVLLADAMQKPITEGGNMPVRTQFLRSTLTAVFGSGLPVRVDHPGGTSYSYNPGEVNAILRTATVRKHKVTLAYAASYAGHANYRHQFVKLATQRWPEFVATAAAKVKSVG